MTKPGYGKLKGGAFERDICRILSLWISDGKNEDCFWRSAMSGGRSTVAAIKGKRLATQAGDISPIHANGHALTDRFLIECKDYKDLQYQGLITNKGHLVTFWRETKVKAKKYNKFPMMIAHQNRQPDIVCLSLRGVEMLGLKLQYTLRAPKLSLYIVTLDDFQAYAVRPT